MTDRASGGRFMWFPATSHGVIPEGLRRYESDLSAGSIRQVAIELTTRADDSHAAPVHRPRREGVFPHRSDTCQVWVRFFALRRIKPHAPPLVRAPVNSFEFQPCGRTPQAEHLVR